LLHIQKRAQLPKLGDNARGLENKNSNFDIAGEKLFMTGAYAAFGITPGYIQPNFFI